MNGEKIICAECEHVRLLEHWTQRHTALRCENPACGEWYGRIVEICPAGMDIRARGLEAPAWCAHRRKLRITCDNSLSQPAADSSLGEGA